MNDFKDSLIEESWKIWEIVPSATSSGPRPKRGYEGSVVHFASERRCFFWGPPSVASTDIPTYSSMSYILNIRCACIRHVFVVCRRLMPC